MCKPTDALDIQSHLDSVAAEQIAYEARVAYIQEEYGQSESSCRHCLEVEPSEIPNIAVAGYFCPDCLDSLRQEHAELTRENKALRARLDPKRRAFEVVFGADGSATVHIPPRVKLPDYEIAKGAVSALLRAVGQ